MSATAADGQVDAFERFFLDEHPKLVALGLAWTGDPDAARHQAQEAMVRANASWDRVSGLDIPGAWVRRGRTDSPADAVPFDGCDGMFC